MFDRTLFKEAYKMGYKKALKEAANEQETSAEAVKEVIGKIATKPWWDVFGKVNNKENASISDDVKILFSEEGIRVFSQTNQQEIEKFTINDVVGGKVGPFNQLVIKLTNGNIYSAKVWRGVTLTEPWDFN